MARWRFAGVVVWAVLGGILVVGIQYLPVFGDPGERSLGGELVRGLVFALALLVFGLVRQVRRERRRSQSQNLAGD